MEFQLKVDFALNTKHELPRFDLCCNIDDLIFVKIQQHLDQHGRRGIPWVAEHWEVLPENCTPRTLKLDLNPDLTTRSITCRPRTLFLCCFVSPDSNEEHIPRLEHAVARLQNFVIENNDGFAVYIYPFTTDLDKKFPQLKMGSAYKQNEYHHTRERLFQHLKSISIPSDPKLQHEAVVYFIGHGAEGNGDWILMDGRVSLADVYKIFEGDLSDGRPTIPLTIISHCCYSGHWADTKHYLNKNLSQLNLRILASCGPNSTSQASTISSAEVCTWTSMQWTGAWKRDVELELPLDSPLPDITLLQIQTNEPPANQVLQPLSSVNHKSPQSPQSPQDQFRRVCLQLESVGLTIRFDAIEAGIDGDEFGCTDLEMVMKILQFCDDHEEHNAFEISSSLHKHLAAVALLTPSTPKTHLIEVVLHRLAMVCPPETVLSFTADCNAGGTRPEHWEQSLPPIQIRSVRRNNDPQTELERAIRELQAADTRSMLFHGCTFELAALTSYHGIARRVANSTSDKSVDFGRGFYLNQQFEGETGAVAWAIRKAQACRSRAAVVLVYERHNDKDLTGAALLGEDWATTVTSCRGVLRSPERRLQQMDFLEGAIAKLHQNRWQALENTWQVALCSVRAHHHYDDKLLHIFVLE